MSISLDQIYSKMGAFVKEAEDNLETHMKEMKADNTQDMLKMQALVQKWSMAVNLSTNMMNTVKDATKTVVQNMR